MDAERVKTGDGTRAAFNFFYYPLPEGHSRSHLAALELHTPNPTDQRSIQWAGCKSTHVLHTHTHTHP